MRIKPAALGVIAIICIVQPLMRFADSPTFETARAVDIAHVFVSGLMTGVLLATLRLRSRAPKTSAEPGSGR